MILLAALLQAPAVVAQVPLIETAETVPAAEQWLQPGDRLQVRLKGQPGATVTFLGGKLMTEVPSTLTGGQAGIYQGTYVVQPGDTLLNQPIAFELLTADSARAVAFSQTNVRFLNQNVPQLAVTTGPLAYLNYGLGEDRLGGAKMGYLDSLVLLHVTGKIGEQYRVRLAENQTAWIPQNSVRFLPPGGFVPAALTGSWSVQGDSLFDYVRVLLTARLPYRSQILTNPTRLVIDVFGATSNTNWITQRAGLQALGDVHYEQVQPDVFRLVLHLRHRQSWGYSVGYQKNTLTVRVNRPPAKLRLRGLTVAVDAGHGGTNTGAVGASGAREKDLTLAIAQQLQRELQRKGARVLMTREADESVDNGDRILRLRRANPDLLVSIHVNSSANKTVRGTSTYYRYVGFRALSVALYQQMLATGLPGFGNVGSFNFGLNGPTEYPNALVETAFVSNPEDERLLISPAFQRQMALRMTKGLAGFLRASRQPGLRGWLSRRPAKQ